MVVQETDEHLDDGADSSGIRSVSIPCAHHPSSEEVVALRMAHVAEVEVGFLWSPSSALTSPPTIQMQQMQLQSWSLELSRGGNSDEDEDDSSSEEVLAIFILGFYVNIVLSLSGGS